MRAAATSSSSALTGTVCARVAVEAAQLAVGEEAGEAVVGVEQHALRLARRLVGPPPGRGPRTCTVAVPPKQANSRWASPLTTAP